VLFPRSVAAQQEIALQLRAENVIGARAKCDRRPH
jgi:hypothetical protein